MHGEEKMRELDFQIYAALVGELRDAKLFQEAYGLVSIARQHKTDKLRTEQDKCLSVGAELLLLYSLQKCGIPRGQLSFFYGKYLKPYLKDNQDIQFNLSHSKEAVLCVVAPCEVGCDIEQLSKPRYDVAKRFFTPKEYETIANAGDEAAQARMFYRFWTLKESYMKATGLGMSLPLNEFEISLEGDRIQVSGADKGKQFYFREYDMLEGFSVAVCSSQEYKEKPEVLSILQVVESIKNYS